MNGLPRLLKELAVLTDGGLKRLANVPRLTILLVCLGLLGWGIFTLFQNFLPPYREETALRVIHVFLADLNADDHQDAFLVTNQAHHIIFNDGAGNFTLKRELVVRNYALALGDLHGNGSLDAILVNFEDGEMGGKLITECVEVPSDFVSPAHSEGAPSQVFAFRDGNRDGIPEDFLAGCCGGGTMMMNYANLFSNHRSCLGMEYTRAAALGDLNGDGTLDAFLAKARTRTQFTVPSEIWLNDGLGNFIDSGQRLGNAESHSVALGDLNGDSFLDAVVGNSWNAEIWFNDGQGNFTVGEQRLGFGMTHTIFVSDLNGDDALDLFLGGYSSIIHAWLNDGTGRFRTGQRINYGRYDAVTVGDVTGDGVMDVFVGRPYSYQVWRGDGDGRFSAEDHSSYR